MAPLLAAILAADTFAALPPCRLRPDAAARWGGTRIRWRGLGNNTDAVGCAHDRIAPSKHARHPVLDDQSQQLASSLWVDQPDALAVLKQAHQERLISGDEAIALNHFIKRGWVKLDLELGSNITHAATEFMERAWQHKPQTILAKHDSVNSGTPTPMSHFPADWVDPSTSLPRKAGSKILEAHSHSHVFGRLLTHPKLFRIVELILNDVAVATQSLLFSHGSEQALHRDPWFVPTNPASSMLASWTALEDIDSKSGPLAFIPRSHRLPWTLLDGTGDIIFDGASEEAQTKHRDALFREVKKNGLQLQHFVPRRGEAILWHAGLVHGGSKVEDFSLTRKSFVVHYDKLRNHPSKSASLLLPDGGQRDFTCQNIYESNCMYTFPDPMLCGRQFDSNLPFRDLQ